MLGGIGASHLILVEGEDAMIFHEQLSGCLGIFLWPVFKHCEVSILLQDFHQAGLLLGDHQFRFLWFIVLQAQLLHQFW